MQSSLSLNAPHMYYLSVIPLKQNYSKFICVYQTTCS